MSDKKETEITEQNLLQNFGVMQTSYVLIGSHFNVFHGITYIFVYETALDLSVHKPDVPVFATLLRGPT